MSAQHGVNLPPGGLGSARDPVCLRPVSCLTLEALGALLLRHLLELARIDFFLGRFLPRSLASKALALLGDLGLSALASLLGRLLLACDRTLTGTSRLLLATSEEPSEEALLSIGAFGLVATTPAPIVAFVVVAVVVVAVVVVPRLSLPALALASLADGSFFALVVEIVLIVVEVLVAVLEILVVVEVLIVLVAVLEILVVVEVLVAVLEILVVEILVVEILVAVDLVLVLAPALALAPPADRGFFALVVEIVLVEILVVVVVVLFGGRTTAAFVLAPLADRSFFALVGVLELLKVVVVVVVVCV